MKVSGGHVVILLIASVWIIAAYALPIPTDSGVFRVPAIHIGISAHIGAPWGEARANIVAWLSMSGPSYKVEATSVKGRETLKSELERLTNDGWEIFSVNGPQSGGLYEILAHKPG